VNSSYRERISESNEKLVVVKQLRDIIEDELLNDMRRDSSFIQLTNFKSKLSILQYLVNKSKDEFYSPILSVLVHLASEKNFSDQSILKEILSNINQLEGSIRAFIKTQEITFTESLKNLKQEEENLQKELDTFKKFERFLISSMHFAVANRKILSKDLAHLKSEIKRKRSEQSMFNKLCEIEEDEFKGDSLRIQLIRKDLDEAFKLGIELN